MRMEGNKRKTAEEEEESMLRKTVKYVKTLERTEAKKESEETLEVVDLAGVEVNEEEVEWTTEGETQYEEEGSDLHVEQVRQMSGAGDELHGQDAWDVRGFVLGKNGRRKQERPRARRNVSTE